jgi:hypothetical protein
MQNCTSCSDMRALSLKCLHLIPNLGGGVLARAFFDWASLNKNETINVEMFERYFVVFNRWKSIQMSYEILFFQSEKLFSTFQYFSTLGFLFRETGFHLKSQNLKTGGKNVFINISISISNKFIFSWYKTNFPKIC